MNDALPRKSERAFTFVELVAAMTIILLLATMAVPLARVQLQRARETELRRELRMMREAIDNYKNMSDRGMIPVKADTMGYPPDLKNLVKGVSPDEGSNTKYKFLGRIPVYLMTGKSDWGTRSEQDDPGGQGGGGQNVFDVFSKSQAAGLDGTPYVDW